MYKQHSKADDLPLKDVKSEFIRNFELFLKTEKKLQQNTMVRYLKCMKKIINMGLANDWIRINLFANIRFREEEVNVGFLTKDELCRLRDKEITINRLEVVRDTFLFCFFTGLTFIDVYDLKLEHLVDDGNGHMWLRKNRVKTGIMCNIPLLDVPYKDCDEFCIKSAAELWASTIVILSLRISEFTNSIASSISNSKVFFPLLKLHTMRFEPV